VWVGFRYNSEKGNRFHSFDHFALQYKFCSACGRFGGKIARAGLGRLINKL